ncbi:uncharacterized protein LOC116805034 [Drosophila grimshawi]|uniref:uncharacterized protein LOC116805034 n=1 Tax=Drosophila grimshawi TaxID=7222 RepID=UPI000C870823|nr:uncharacterized protein LOC116805034 [Drosophila grimshawi]
MFLSKRNTQVSIGLAVMALALATTVLKYRYRFFDCLAFVRATQLTATVALIFGVVRANPQHKAKFLLFWLSLTAVFLTALFYMAVDLLSEFDFRYSIWYLTALFLPLPAAAGVAYLMNIIYKDYTELTIQTVTESKQPPSYDSSLQTLLVSLGS